MYGVSSRAPNFPAEFPTAKGFGGIGVFSGAPSTTGVEALTWGDGVIFPPRRLHMCITATLFKQIFFV